LYAKGKERIKYPSNWQNGKIVTGNEKREDDLAEWG
jgi:hypothetical protein